MNIDELNDAESNGPVVSSMKILNLIFIALLLGQFAFAGIILFLHQSQDPVTDNQLHFILQYTVPLVAVTSIGLTKIIHDKLLAKVAENASLSVKLSKYRTATILRLAGLEAANMFALVSYLLTGQTYYLYIYGIIIVLFLLAKPSTYKFHEQLGE